MRLFRVLFTAFFIALAFGFSLGAHADLATAFPDPADFAESFAAFQNLDLASDSVVMTHSKGGTSAYAVLSVNGVVQGAFIPPNGASQIDGEAGAYSLAKILGVADSVQAGKLSSISGKALERFRAMLATDHRPGPPAENIQHLNAWMDSHPDRPLPGVMKLWNHRPYDFDELIDPTTRRLNAKNPIAAWIRADGPQPTEAPVTRVAGKVEGRNTELALARELSAHLLIDALLGQWDRFSGGNLQIFTDGSALHFALYDNGGTWGTAANTKSTLAAVSRFDRAAATRLHEMLAFLKGRGEFYGAKDEAELRRFLQLTVSNLNWRTFKKNLAAVVAAIDAVPESDEKYFPSPAADPSCGGG